MTLIRHTLQDGLTATHGGVPPILYSRYKASSCAISYNHVAAISTPDHCTKPYCQETALNLL